MDKEKERNKNEISLFEWIVSSFVFRKVTYRLYFIAMRIFINIINLFNKGKGGERVESKRIISCARVKFLLIVQKYLYISSFAGFDRACIYIYVYFHDEQ